MKLIERYFEEWNGGGQKEIIARADDGTETSLAKNYIGYDEFSHGVSIEWHLTARIKEDPRGILVQIEHYNIRSGYTFYEPNWDNAICYLSTDNGKTWTSIK